MDVLLFGCSGIYHSHVSEDFQNFYIKDWLLYAPSPLIILSRRIHLMAHQSICPLLELAIGLVVILDFLGLHQLRILITFSRPCLASGLSLAVSLSRTVCFYSLEQFILLDSILWCSTSSVPRIGSLLPWFRWLLLLHFEVYWCYSSLHSYVLLYLT